MLPVETENAILDGIRDVVRLVEQDHCAPTDAVYKVATAKKWSQHCVARVCEAYNTGRQESQRKHADAAMDKFASFPLADADEVLSRMFAANFDKPAEVSDDYNWAPKLPATPVPLTKAASVTVAKADPLPPDAAHAAGAPFRKRAALRRKLANLTTERSIVAEHLRREIAKVANYFRGDRYRRQPFGFVEKVAVADHGEPMRVLFDHLQRIYKIAEKRAADFGPLPFPPDRTASPYTELQEILRLNQALTSAKLAEKQAADALQAHEQEMFKPPFVERRSLFDKASAALPIGMAVGAATKSLADKAFAGIGADRPTTNDLVEREWLKLDDPGHFQKLRQIQTQAMLSDFMANDDIISSYRPEQVLTMYNELQTAVPNLATQPAVMRAHLRRALQSHLEPYEVAEMLRLEQGAQQARGSAIQLATPNPTTLRFAPVPTGGR